MPLAPARTAAFDILLRVEHDSAYASELLHSITFERLSTPDHALATELVMGVLRWRSLLDAQITTASSQSLSKLDVEVLIALRLAVYQFLWLDRVPQRAALHESVELVKRARKRSAAPFVNAVLRKLSTTATVHKPFPEDQNSTPENLASEFAHPLWLVERWTQEYGFAATRQICQHDQSIPPTAIRLRTPTAEAELLQEGITLRPGGFLASARIVESGDVTQTQIFHDRKVVIQDEASHLVAALIGQNSEQNGTRILDCCAAPGGKTLAIADHYPHAVVTAVELHPHRARLMQKLLPSTARIEVVVGDAERLTTSLPFDRVLADVPCSGTGTLARNPEIKWRLVPSDLAELHLRQCAILRSALAHVARGGRLVYSTCSLEKEENEDVIQRVLQELKREQKEEEQDPFRVVDCSRELERLRATGELIWREPASLTRGPYLRTIPGVHPCDGFFAAILERV